MLGDGAGHLASADNGVEVIGPSYPVTSSTSMFGAAVDNSGNIFVSDTEQSCIYKVTESGNIKVYAGVPGTSGFANGAPSVARFDKPMGLAVDKTGNLYVCDNLNGAIRRINTAGNTNTVITGLTDPRGVACAPNGDLYVTDATKHVVYLIKYGWANAFVLAGALNTSGDVAAVFGPSARFNTPIGITVDSNGSVFVVDSGNYKIKKITLDGYVTRYCGSIAGDVDGQQTNAKFTSPTYLAVDRSGVLFVLDTGISGNDKIKRIDRNGVVSTVSHITSGSSRGITVSSADVIYVTVSAAGSTNSSSSSSSSSHSSTSSASSASSNSSSSSHSSASSASSQSSHH